MFNGLITELGTVSTIKKSSSQKKGAITLTIHAPRTASKLKKGGSIAIDGACLTAINTTKTTFTVEAIPETMAKTIISRYQKGTTVNLELPITLKTPLDGHFVLGHIDAIAQISAIKNETLELTPPKNLMKYIAQKGSIAINGVSLTISKRTASTFQVSLIPETLKKTNLGHLKIKNHLNLEVDLIARYLENLR